MATEMQTQTGRSRSRALLERLCCAKVDISGLAVFRIAFGLLMFWATVRFLANGWVEELYLRPRFFFTYEFVPWAKPWPGFWMYVHFAALAVLAIGIAIGFCYRICTFLFFVGFTYVELIDKTTYLNHYYLVTLLCGLMIFLPAHREFSFDVWRRPALRVGSVSAWTVNILRFQFAAVYIFAGLAKLNHDWLIEAQPLRIWLAARSDMPLIGPLLDETWVAYAASWIGAAYDLTIVFFLMRGRTRPFAYAAVIVFHLATALLFRIGMFPWIMIAGALLFFPPDWPRRWRGGLISPTSSASMPVRPLALAILAVYVVIQIALPLRHLFASESSAWTMRGFNWSWRVMLVEKTGYAEFRVFNPETGENTKVRPGDYLTARQAQFMTQDPAMIRDLARHIAIEHRAQGHGKVRVFVEAFATLNGRPSQHQVDPNVDFAAPLPREWIMPLEIDRPRLSPRTRAAPMAALESSGD